ncbi:MAG TPA: alpha/beta hydrolase [Ktedonobacterales bacterium]|nr:alpha/beta hydrolase [Ktedonobacterales bacterium]
MASQDAQASEMAVETAYVDMPSGRTYYEVTGAGHPFLMIHADVADRRMWDEQFATFAQRYRVIRYDKRGFGKTTSQGGPVSLIEDIVALLKHLGISKTYIMGLSNGGRLALDFTLAHPELVDALIVVAGGVTGLEDSATEAEMAVFGQYETLQANNDGAGLLALGIHVWCDGPTQPEGRAAQEVRDRIRTMMTDTYHDHHEKLEPIELEPAAVGRLTELAVPTLVILGSYDFSGTNAAMEFLAEHVNGARKAVFETAHMVNMEQPAAFDALVQEFLDTVSATA